MADAPTRVGDRVDEASLLGQRWFATTAGTVAGAAVEERFELPGGGGLAVLRVETGRREKVRYSLPLPPEAATWRGLRRLAASGDTVTGDAGWTLRGVPPALPLDKPKRTPDPARGRGTASGAVTARPLGVDQSNTTWVVGEAVVKLYRRLAPGRNPEVELAAALGAADPGAPIPAFMGALRLQAPAGMRTGPTYDIAVVQRFLPAAVDEFERIADALAAWLGAGAPAGEADHVLPDLELAGRTVAAFHASMAALRGPGLTPRPGPPADRQRAGSAASRALREAVAAMRGLDPPLAQELRAARSRVDAALAPLGAVSGSHLLTRIHGDLHIGQLLRDGDRFLVTDLEGEPTRSVSQRRRVDLPLRDVAPMLRSFDHVARSGARRAAVPQHGAAIDAWIDAARAAFLGGYGSVVDGSLLHALEMEKELYEFTYAARYLPEWRYAPAGGLRWLLARGSA